MRTAPFVLVILDKGAFFAYDIDMQYIAYRGRKTPAKI